RIYSIDGLLQTHPKWSPPPEVALDEFVGGLHLLSPSGITYASGKLWVAGSDTFTGYGNFMTSILNENGENIRSEKGELMGQADFEKPMPKFHPSINPGTSLATLEAAIKATP